MLRAVMKMAAFGQEICGIVANYRASRRKENLLAYLRLRIQTAWAGLRNRAAGKVIVFGKPVEYLDREALIFLFEEIFCQQNYYFASETDSPVILDCGANIGLSVIYFKRMYPASRILAFEPDPQTCGVLRRNLERHGCGDVELHEKALAATNGSIPFYFDPEKPGSPLMSIVEERLHKTKTMVGTARLSEFLTSEVDFLKLDIEGAEMEVLKEAESAGRLRAVRQMIIEYHHHVKPERDEFSELLLLLERNGFGYQIGSTLLRPFPRKTCQDVLIFAYRK